MDRQGEPAAGWSRASCSRTRSKSYHATHRVTDHDIFDNRLIFGDNLLALKALGAEFTGKIKCVYIDPPYNTGSRVRALRRRNGAFPVAVADAGPVGDHPATAVATTDRCGSRSMTTRRHYLKVLCDEVFGRSQFRRQHRLARKVYAPKTTALHFSVRPRPCPRVRERTHALWKRNLLPRSEERRRRLQEPRQRSPRSLEVGQSSSARKYYSLGLMQFDTHPAGR